MIHVPEAKKHFEHAIVSVILKLGHPTLGHYYSFNTLFFTEVVVDIVLNWIII